MGSVGLQQALGYVHQPPNAARRAVQWVAATRPAAWTLARLLPPLDRMVLRRSHGRRTLTQPLAGLPVITLTSTGAKSGQPRTTPLIAVPVGDDLALIGTNFGQRATPDWAYNLEAHPQATVTYRDRAVAVEARRATAAEADAIIAASAHVYGGYRRYRARITGREVRVFVLTHPT